MRSETLLHMNTVYRYRAVLLAHNGQESVNVTCPRHYREDLSDLIHMSLLRWEKLRPWRQGCWLPCNCFETVKVFFNQFSMLLLIKKISLFLYWNTLSCNPNVVKWDNQSDKIKYFGLTHYHIFKIIAFFQRLHMTTVYQCRVVLLAHNGQESVNVTRPRYIREGLSDSSSFKPTYIYGERDVDIWKYDLLITFHIS